MPDYYQLPALVLTALLVPAFWHLYLRYRDTRTLLWFLGFVIATFRTFLLLKLGSWDAAEGTHPWWATAGQASMQISSALFLASLSPLRFRVARYHVLYVIPYTLPLVAYSVIFHGFLRGATPSGLMYAVLPLLGSLSLMTALFWSFCKGALPVWLSAGFCSVAGAIGLMLYYSVGPSAPLSFIDSSNHLMTVLLLIFVFRRFSSGMILSVTGFLCWAATFLLLMPAISSASALDIALTRVVVMGKVIAAIGMILLSLEDQLVLNKLAQQREKRSRRELESYTRLMLSRRRVEDFDRQGTEICESVAEHSRFSQAALLLHSGGRYRLAGYAGLDAATAMALEQVAARIPASGFLAQDSAPSAVEQSQTLRLDLTPWLRPGDDLKRLSFTSVLAVPMTGRSGTDGALLLEGIRPAIGPPGHDSSDLLRADDLLAIEMLAARVQASRSQTMIFEKLIDSEKYSGLGQLAGNVTQQLNNPLTVILGYASLLEGTSSLEPQDRKGVEAILIEARRMRSTLDSLSRIARPLGDQLAAVSVSEMLTDIEQLHRSEFLRRSIQFHLNISPTLPRVMCSAHQLRQAVMHSLQFAEDAVQNQADGDDEVKSIRLEAACEGQVVQILVAHSGPGFLDPERAFDPFAPVQAGGETAGLGLSLCATLLRDNNGRALAVNLEPRGAAIILELRAA